MDPILQQTVENVLPMQYSKTCETVSMSKRDEKIPCNPRIECLGTREYLVTRSDGIKAVYRGYTMLEVLELEKEKGSS
jgi:hypothetical protein